RRRTGDIEWTRVASAIAPLPGASRGQYEYLDRDAEPGAQLEYRLLYRLPDGRDQVVGTLSMRNDAARALILQLRPVQPQPFRPGAHRLDARGAARCIRRRGGHARAALSHVGNCGCRIDERRRGD